MTDANKIISRFIAGAAVLAFLLSPSPLRAEAEGGGGGGEDSDVTLESYGRSDFDQRESASDENLRLLREALKLLDGLKFDEDG